MLSVTLKRTYKEIPSGVKSFLKRAVLLSLAWVFVYHYVLLPSRAPDKWLTNTTANVTAFVLGKCYSSGFSFQEIKRISSLGADINGAEVLLNKNKVIFIADACNGLALFALYAGFILCVPAGIKRTAVFMVGGIAAIFILNIARCCALAWLWLNQREWVDFAHHYIFTLIVYCCIFVLWVWFSQKQMPANEKV